MKSVHELVDPVENEHKMKEAMVEDNVVVSDDEDSIDVGDHPRSKASKENHEEEEDLRLDTNSTRLSKSPPGGSGGSDSGVNSFLKFSIQNILQATSTAAAVAAAACAARRSATTDKTVDDEVDKPKNQALNSGSGIGSSTSHVPLW